jgi:hypothetical protein
VYQLLDDWSRHLQDRFSPGVPPSRLEACAATATLRSDGAHPGHRVVLVVLVTALEGDTPTTTAWNSATVAGWTLVSRATGLLRVVVIGAVLGPTYFANCVQAGYVVPSIVVTLITGPVLAMVLVPGVVRAIGDGGLPRAREVLGRVAGWLLVVSLAVVAF